MYTENPEDYDLIRELVLITKVYFSIVWNELTHEKAKNTYAAWFTATKSSTLKGWEHHAKQCVHLWHSISAWYLQRIKETEIGQSNIDSLNEEDDQASAGMRWLPENPIDMQWVDWRLYLELLLRRKPIGTN